MPQAHHLCWYVRRLWGHTGTSSASGVHPFLLTSETAIAVFYFHWKGNKWIKERARWDLINMWPFCSWPASEGYKIEAELECKKCHMCSQLSLLVKCLYVPFSVWYLLFEGFKFQGWELRAVFLFCGHREARILGLCSVDRGEMKKDRNSEGCQLGALQTSTKTELASWTVVPSCPADL